MDTTMMRNLDGNPDGNSDGPSTRVADPHAVPFPEGPLWDRLGHELVYGRDPVQVAYEYGESVGAVKELDDLFWDGYSRSRWLEEAEEYGILQEAIGLDNEALIARLEEERTREAVTGAPA